MNSSTKYQLPVKKATITEPLSARKISRVRPPPNFLNVLIIDDEYSRGMANTDMISGLGHAVELARDGITALRMAAANRPDAVLLDNNLQSLEECAVARHLRSDFPDQPPLIIGFATEANSLVRRQCVDAGMDMVLESPLNVEAIEAVLLFESAKLAADMNADSPRRSRRQRAKLPTQSLAVAIVDEYSPSLLK